MVEFLGGFYHCDSDVANKNTPVIIVCGDNGSICRVTFVLKDWYKLVFSTSESGRGECFLDS